MFKTINHISDIQPLVAHKKEIRFIRLPIGITMGCYMFMDKETFDSPEAQECRGICFDDSGSIVSRPLHKFFNVGEKEWLSPEKLAARDDIVAIYDKIDGSMIATAWFGGKLHWRSKKSFDSHVVALAEQLLQDDANKGIAAFAAETAAQGMTAVFELTHPDARIIVASDKPQLQLLHVRKNDTGSYVMLDEQHPIHDRIRHFNVPVIRKIEGLALDALFASLADMEDKEGYVIQFANGDMAKIKCPWYARLHQLVSRLRERDIAELALNNQLDDVKEALIELQIDLTEVEKIETRLKNRLLEILDAMEVAYQADKDLARKDFAIKNKEHPLFGLMMARYSGQEPRIAEWYGRNHLRDEFTLRELAEGALAEELEG